MFLISSSWFRLSSVRLFTFVFEPSLRSFFAFTFAKHSFFCAFFYPFSAILKMLHLLLQFTKRNLFQVTAKSCEIVHHGPRTALPACTAAAAQTLRVFAAEMFWHYSCSCFFHETFFDNTGSFFPSDVVRTCFFADNGR